MKTITKEILDRLSNEAKDTLRKRKNLNYHNVLSDPLQRLLNAMEPDTYVQPHKHESPNKRELFIILRGKALVVTYNDNGEIRDFFKLDSASENYGVEIPEKVWHSIIILETGTVLFETKDGPYDAILDKNFANWLQRKEIKNALVSIIKYYNSSG